MEKLPEPKSEALRARYWRAEILQLLLWIRGEGLGDTLDPGTVERFLGVAAKDGARYLERLAEEGMLHRACEGAYRLSPAGVRRSAEVFAADFAEFTQPTRGECGPDCWCRASVQEADVCRQRRPTGQPASTAY